MSRRALVLSLAAVALVAALVIGLRQSADSTDPTPAASTTLDLSVLEGAPAPLAALHAQAGQLLPGGRKAYEARLAELKGRPAVVNLWAAWCGPCREELPVFQEVSLDRGREIAFLGINYRDSPDAARRLMAKIPQPWPSFEDGDGRIGDTFGVAGLPATVFYDREGEQAFVHQGPYFERADLEADIERHALR